MWEGASQEIKREILGDVVYLRSSLVVLYHIADGIDEGARVRTRQHSPGGCREGMGWPGGGWGRLCRASSWRQHIHLSRNSRLKITFQLFSFFTSFFIIFPRGGPVTVGGRGAGAL